MQFALETFTPAKLVNFNPRSELHGKEAVPAIDLKFSFDAANAILSAFDGHLLSSLYHRAGEGSADGQAALDGVEPVSEVPNLRMPKLGLPLKWDAEQTGCSLTIDLGLGGNRSNIELSDCAVNAFQLEPKEGGTVTIAFRVQCTKGLTEKILGKLATLVQHDVSIQLVGPKLGEQQSVEPESAKQPRAEKTATDQFIERHAGAAAH